MLGLFAGCGPSGPRYHPVAGKVVFTDDDSVAQFGTVELRTESAPLVIARGEINKDGTFELKSGRRLGAVEGWHTVVVIQVVGGARPGNVTHNHGLVVDKKYLDHRTTDLRIEITEDSADGVVINVNAQKNSG